MTASFDSLMPKIGTRAILAGKTGCGKTTLAKQFLLHYMVKGIPSIIAIDPKGTFTLPGTVVTTPEELGDYANEEQLIIYRPNINNTAEQDLDAYNRICKYVLLRGNTVWYCDESFALAPDGIRYPEYLRPLYTRGREFNVTAIGATQRPARIPREMYTEATNFYLFMLKALSDRQRMAEMMGPKALIMPTGYNFWFYADDNPEEIEPIYTCLNMGVK